MRANFTRYLWLLKLGALVNLVLLATTLVAPASGADPHIVFPAQVLFAVSAFRCLFPTRYKDNVVFHRSPLSSIFLTRLLATAVEVVWIYQFSYVLRVFNVERVTWVDTLSWFMVVQVLISQGFVWGAIVRGRLEFYTYEEVGWGLIFAANTIASLFLFLTVELAGGLAILLPANLLFGAFYLSLADRPRASPRDRRRLPTGRQGEAHLDNGGPPPGSFRAECQDRCRVLGRHRRSYLDDCLLGDGDPVMDRSRRARFRRLTNSLRLDSRAYARPRAGS